MTSSTPEPTPDERAVTLRKACSCTATASGPRYVSTEERIHHGARVTITYALMACDECNTPYQIVTPS